MHVPCCLVWILHLAHHAVIWNRKVFAFSLLNVGVCMFTLTISGTRLHLQVLRGCLRNPSERLVRTECRPPVSVPSPPEWTWVPTMQLERFQQRLRAGVAPLEGPGLQWSVEVEYVIYVLEMTWSGLLGFNFVRVYSYFFPLCSLSSAHRPRSPRQNNVGRASPGSSSLSSPQTGTAPVETVTTLSSASSPTAASPAPNLVTSPSGEGEITLPK